MSKQLWLIQTPRRAPQSEMQALRESLSKVAKDTDSTFLVLPFGMRCTDLLADDEELARLGLCRADATKCEHANEVPHVCNCGQECACRGVSCPKIDARTFIQARELLKQVAKFYWRCFSTDSSLNIGGVQLDHTLLNNAGNGAEAWLKRYGGMTQDELLCYYESDEE